MFDKLLNAFAGVAKSLGEKELREKDIDDILFDLELSLLESDVASEVVDTIKSDLKKDLIGTRVEKSVISDTVRSSLISSISSLFDAAGSMDVIDLVRKKKEEAGQPFLILFVGINGTGKTTSLAKVAYMLQQAKYSVVVAASDTFRAGAIEQLKEHTKRLNLKLVAQNYNSDPAAVARDAVLYAKAHRTDCVLIDTAGRMQTSKNLMEQIAKITNVVKPDLKIFVGDSLAGNDTVNQAREFFEHTRFDAAILTKADADARGGAALSIAKVTSAPVIFVGVGQEYVDLKPFDKKVFLEIVFGTLNEDDLRASPPTQRTQKKTSKKHTEAMAAAATTTEEATPTRGEPSKGDSAKDNQKTAAADSELKTDMQPELPTDSVSSKPKERDSPVAAATTTASAPPSPQYPDSAPSSDTPQDSRTGEISTHDDPFYGIEDSDIAAYSDKFDAPPPENDGEALDLARNIQRWIKDGRPDSAEYIRESASRTDTDTIVDAGDNTKYTAFENGTGSAPDGGNDAGHRESQNVLGAKDDVMVGNDRDRNDDDDNDDHSPDDDAQQDKSTGKPKKKRGMFGFLKRGDD